MKQKSMIYLFLLISMIAAFFIFTGGITSTSTNYVSPSLTNFSLLSASPVIYAKLPFSIQAENKSYNHKDCDDEYSSARDLVGSLVIKQGATVIGTSSFIFISQSGSDKGGYTGTFVDTVVINNAGTYTATATFYDSNDPNKVPSTMNLSFSVGFGSETPLSAGTYRLSSFTAACVSSTLPPFTFTNTSASNNLIINSDGLTASLNINMHIGYSVITQYPCLQDSSYNFSAAGNYSVVSTGSSKFFNIEYQPSAFVNFDYTFDGTNLSLNYSKDRSAYIMSFVKQ
jgi:hypothetical protein